MNVEAIGSVIGLIVVFVIPGWLLTNIFWGNGKRPDHVLFIFLTLISGVVLVALGLFILSLFHIIINRGSVTILGISISLLLTPLLFLRARKSDSKYDWPTILGRLIIPVIIVPVIYIFIGLHGSRVEESYTEFYVIPRGGTGINQTSTFDLVIVSHENRDIEYSIVCGDRNGNDNLLKKTMLNPGSIVITSIELPLIRENEISKVQIYLYRDIDIKPYRGVELNAMDCGSLAN